MNFVKAECGCRGIKIDDTRWFVVSHCCAEAPLTPIMMQGYCTRGDKYTPLSYEEAEEMISRIKHWAINSYKASELKQALKNFLV